MVRSIGTKWLESKRLKDKRYGVLMDSGEIVDCADRSGAHLKQLSRFRYLEPFMCDETGREEDFRAR